MWMKQSLRFCIMLALLVATNDCGTLIKDPVSINDEPLYFLKQASTDQWAVQMHFLTSGQSQITQGQWNAMSQGMVAMPLSAFSDFNTEIGKLCSQIPCNYQIQQAQKNISTLIEMAKDYQKTMRQLESAP